MGIQISVYLVSNEHVAKLERASKFTGLGHSQTLKFALERLDEQIQEWQKLGLKRNGQ